MQHLQETNVSFHGTQSAAQGTECRVFDIWCHNIESMAHNLRETIAILKALESSFSGWSESNRSRGRNSSVGWPLAYGIGKDGVFLSELIQCKKALI
jgi:hypothetical protein